MASSAESPAAPRLDWTPALPPTHPRDAEGRGSRELCPLPEPGDNRLRASTFLMRTGEGTDAFLGRRATPGTAAPQRLSPDRCLVQGYSPFTRTGKPKTETQSRDSIYDWAAENSANAVVLPLDNRGPYRCWAAGASLRIGWKPPAPWIVLVPGRVQAAAGIEYRRLLCFNHAAQNVFGVSL